MTERTEVDFINEKINILQQQISNEEMAKFQHELTVDDAKESMADGLANNALKVQAKNALAAIAVCDRRLTVRKAKLAELEAALNEAGPDLGA